MFFHSRFQIDEWKSHESGGVQDGFWGLINGVIRLYVCRLLPFIFF